jgi:hypothetical protein
MEDGAKVMFENNYLNPKSNSAMQPTWSCILRYLYLQTNSKWPQTSADSVIITWFSLGSWQKKLSHENVRAKKFLGFQEGFQEGFQ